MLLSLCFVTFLAIFTGAQGSGDSSWGYGSGQHQWSTNRAWHCGGRQQSPINLAGAVEQRSLRSQRLVLSGYNAVKDISAKANDHGVTFTPQGRTMTVTGGGLSERYCLEQFHFHWGANLRRGSEHHINGKPYPLEMHAVHYKCRYGSVDSALSSGDKHALAVLGFMFETSYAENSKFSDILQAAEKMDSMLTYYMLATWVEYLLRPVEARLTGMKKIRWNPSGKSPRTFNFAAFLRPATNGQFYRYQGSLTTPPCNEQVVWTVFKTPLKISQRELQKFKSRMTMNSYLEKNYRFVQAVNGRPIYLA